MTQSLRAMEVTGADAPDRTVTLHVVRSDYGRGYDAFYEQGYCGCADCHCLIGRGMTEVEAIEDYWSAWEEKYVQ